MTPLRRVFLTAFLMLAASPALRAADWPQFLGPHRNGTTTETNLAAAWPKDGPPVLWQKSVGQGFAGPVVAGGRLIVFHRLADQEIVEALDAKSGQALWKAEYPTHYRDDFGMEEGPRSTPAIAADAVFTFGADGMLSAWKLASGDKLWSVDTRKQFSAGKGFFGPVCSPLVDGNAVILNVGGLPGAGIVAFDRSSGRVLWKTSDDEASYSSPVIATLDGKRRLLVVTREALVAANPADGKIGWRYPWTPPMSASVSAAVPLVIGEEIFLSASYGTGATLLRFKEAGPEKVWSKDDVLSNHYATSVHHNGFLYGFDGRQEQGCKLRCVEWKTGKVRWSESGLRAGTVMIVNDQLLVMTERGELIRTPASPEKFKPTDRAQILPFTVRAHPALADGLFYARSKDKLACVDLRAKP